MENLRLHLFSKNRLRLGLQVIRTIPSTDPRLLALKPDMDVFGCGVAPGIGVGQFHAVGVAIVHFEAEDHPPQPVDQRKLTAGRSSQTKARRQVRAGDLNGRLDRES